jgi:penicillin-binding protein 1A
MQGGVNGGTGYGLRGRFNLTGEIGGKTGTTNDNADGWFIGYTPQLTAGAWAGFEDMQVHFAATANGGGAGAALPIWGYFMQMVRKDPSLVKYYDKEAFDAPNGFELNIDCDADAIIMKVEQIGAACHEGYRSCFFRQLDIDKENIDIDNLTDDDIAIISERLFDPKEMYG